MTETSPRPQPVHETPVEVFGTKKDSEARRCRDCSIPQASIR